MPEIGGDNEERNYMYLASIVSGILKNKLRELFIREWNRLYPSTPWDYTPTSGGRLHQMEKKRFRTISIPYEYQRGNTRDWDSTVLFRAILYSNAIRESGLSDTHAAAVDELRRVRNKVAHFTSNKVPNSLYETMIETVKRRFLELGLSTDELVDIAEEKNNYLSFKVLPDLLNFTFEVAESEVFDTLWELELKRNVFVVAERDVNLNPIGDEWFRRKQESDIRNRFVMTLDGENEDTMLESYKNFTANLHCDENVISDILASSMTKSNKILNLKAEVKSKVKYFNSWLIIVIHVVDLKKTLRFIPQPGEEGWENGRNLIMTSDVGAVPIDSKYTKSITL